MYWNEDLKLNYSDYIVFVYESGDHSLTSFKTEYPVFVLCFCIVHKEAYVNQIVPDIQRLKVQTFGHDQVIIHEHDIRKKKCAFSQLNKEARDQFMSDLSNSMNNVPLTIVAVVIDKIKHTNRYARPYHPYNLALKFGLERVFSFIKLQEQSKDLTHVIVEERGPREDKELELEFRRVCSGQNNTRSKMPFEIIFANKKKQFIRSAVSRYNCSTNWFICNSTKPTKSSVRHHKGEAVQRVAELRGGQWTKSVPLIKQ